MSKNKLIIFSAPSGAGKTTIINNLLKKLDDKLEFSISATSRNSRENEIDGENYYFLSEKEFKNKIQNDDFLEWEEVYENCFYGTLKSEIERIWANNKNVIFDIDVQGALNIKKKYPTNTITIFIYPLSVEILKKRLISRNTENNVDIEKRISKAKQELSFKDEFDKIIINDNLENSVRETFDYLKTIIT